MNKNQQCVAQPALHPGEQISAIRAALGFNFTQLASVLKVRRTTLYS